MKVEICERYLVAAVYDEFSKGCLIYRGVVVCVCVGGGGEYAHKASRERPKLPYLPEERVKERERDRGERGPSR